MVQEDRVPAKLFGRQLEGYARAERCFLEHHGNIAMFQGLGVFQRGSLDAAGQVDQITQFRRGQIEVRQQVRCGNSRDGQWFCQGSGHGRLPMNDYSSK